MDMKELLKELLNDENINVPSDIILDTYIQKSKNAILKECWITEEGYNNLNLQIQTAELAKHFYVNRKNNGLKQKSSGSMQQIYLENAIPNSIKATLPINKIFGM